MVLGSGVGALLGMIWGMNHEYHEYSLSLKRSPVKIHSKKSFKFLRVYNRKWAPGATLAFDISNKPLLRPWRFTTPKTHWIFLVLVMGGLGIIYSLRRQGLYLVYKRYFSCQLGWLYATTFYVLSPEKSVISHPKKPEIPTSMSRKIQVVEVWTMEDEGREDLNLRRKGEKMTRSQQMCHGQKSLYLGWSSHL